MPTASISGLSSGLDTASIISQLMVAEAAPQTRIKTALGKEQSNLKTLQELNTKVAALAVEAGKLAAPGGWTSVKVGSSSELVVGVGTSDAATGSLRLTVQQTARAHDLGFASTAALTDPVTAGSTLVRLTLADGTTQDLDTQDGTLGGLLGALNGPGTGVRATTLKLDDGSYRLRVTATASGAASTFTVTNLDGSDLLGGATVTAGQDAAITIGSDTVHSATNTFAGVVSGLDITLKPGVAPGTVVDLSVERDTTSVAEAVRSLVDNLNAVLGAIDSASSYNAATKSAGALRGEPAVRDLRTTLARTVFPADGSTLVTAGIALDRYGKVSFDKAAFAKAFAEDPVAVAEKFLTGASTGFAARVEAVSKVASNSVDGALTTAVKSHDVTISRMKDSIEAWDTRLQLRRATLTRTYTALETALSQLQAQGNWLSGQLSSLSTSSS